MVVYYGVGSACEFFSAVTRLGGDELSLVSQLCSSIAKHSFTQTVKEFHAPNAIPISHSSWHANQKLLSEIPVASHEDLQLVHFLQEHWLTKTAGFASMATHWVYPCFDIPIQVHPLTDQAYARLPKNRLSETYKKRVAAWKQELPHPNHFPLILTRPANIQDYLPKCVVDVSALEGLDPLKTICIQSVFQEHIGGIRILPLEGQSAELVEKNYQFLLDWVSHFGLTANRIELDRWPIPEVPQKFCAAKTDLPDLAAFLSLLGVLDEKWKTGPPHQTLMLCGTLQVLSGLLASLTEEKWREINRSVTRASIVRLSLSKIERQLKQVAQNEPNTPFFTLASQLELIHADIASLLEVCKPFQSEHFSPIYQSLLSIPADLKPLTSCGIHSSAMTSLAGIFKILEKSLGREPRLLYGENTYFECVDIAKKATRAIAVDQASEADFETADLVLVQFNPVLRFGIHTGYKTEDIADILHKCLHAKRNSPLTVALDCTIDFIDSPRVANLLCEFEQEIRDGALNIVGYRSGNKFDLFGMDNYCGAPFFMIHNQDRQWDSFHSLATDPVLQTDPLSLNWFCLAYQFAAPQLELYRKQIFDNTRALLNKTPEKLLSDRQARYQVFPVDNEADPAFIDVKVAGPLHAARGAALVAGTFCVKSLEQGHALFHRPSLGFYHPNFIVLFGEEATTLRLTLGLDPTQVDFFAKCLETLDGLNTNP